MKKRIASLLLALLTALPLMACGIRAQELTRDIRPQALDTATDLTDGGPAITSFALSLLQNTDAGRASRLLSPLSVLYALGMTANGASGETLKQMENAVGMNLTELNDYLYTFRMSLPDNSKKASLSLSDSLWLRDTFRVEDDFLRTCVSYYGAEVYRSAFDATLPADVNAWVQKHTDGMIDAILPEGAPSDVAMLYLVNAAAFDAKWEDDYDKSAVQQDTFYAADGTRQDAEFMWGEENIYLSGHGATGFLKPYAGGRYAFAALLPDEGTSLAELLSTLNGTKLYDLISQHHYSKVETALPKFTGSTELELIPTLEAMGITDLFDLASADLRGMGSAATNNSLYVSAVRHSTFIEVDESGTRAAAVTAVGADTNADGPGPAQQVVLNRPFLYMIVDTHACLPIFMGTVTTLGE